MSRSLQKNACYLIFWHFVQLPKLYYFYSPRHLDFKCKDLVLFIFNLFCNFIDTTKMKEKKYDKRH